MTAGTEKLPCFHCGLPVATNALFFSKISNDEQVFCCPACQMIAEHIDAVGLDDFYRYRDVVSSKPEIEMIERAYEAFDHPAFIEQHVVSRDQQLETTLLIEGMHCAACVWLIEHIVNGVDGVESCHVNFSENTIHIQWLQDSAKLSQLCQAIAKIGYKVEPYSFDRALQSRQLEYKSMLRRMGVAGIAMMQVSMFALANYLDVLDTMKASHHSLMLWVSLLIVSPVVFYSAKPFWVGAWRGLKAGRPGMDLPITLAVFLAYFSSVYATITHTGEVYFDSVAMFVFLLLLGRFLEMSARHQSLSSQGDLASLLPSMATRISAAGEHEVIPTSELVINDRVLIKAGEIIPVDGCVVSGSSRVDESQLTGEFIPQSKHEGSLVVAGTINGLHILEVFAQATGSHIQLQKVKAIIDGAQRNKPQISQLVDRYASHFVIAIILTAVSVFGYWSIQGSAESFWIMLSVLVVSCPCALSLATPVAITAATHTMRRVGILVTDAQVWEKTQGITDVVFDKTGTLTEGVLTLSRIIPVGNYKTDDALLIATLLEQFSEHPIATAFGNKIENNTSQITHVCNDAGQGVSAVIDDVNYRIGSLDYCKQVSNSASWSLPDDKNSGRWVLLLANNSPVAWFELQDSVRSDAQSLVNGLSSMGFSTHLLSGDSSGDAERLAKELSIASVCSGVSTVQKLEYVHRLQSEGRRVLMVGDGINDIPVLAGANLSVAMVNASDLAKSKADCILLNSQILSIINLWNMALRTQSIIRQNLCWAVVYNVIAIPLAAAGVVPPYLAAIGMSASSLMVLLNAMRLQRCDAADLSTMSAGQHYAGAV
ncbi:heavy metal translocating P-type ATPase [bacterium]|nr:heavy metal translocating P-type ATPase [bacterium]